MFRTASIALTCLPFAVKQADGQENRVLKMTSSKPKNFGIPVIKVAPGGSVGALGANRGLSPNNRPAVSGLHPIADERHGHGQHSTETRTH